MRYASCHPDRKHEAKGLCKSCHRRSLPTYNKGDTKAQYRRWRQRNPWANKAGRLRKNYGLKWADYLAMLEAQTRTCKICSAPEPLEVDHCHRTGRVRGLLCKRCNVAVALYEYADRSLQEQIAKYLGE